jgi:hypothetical protein
MVERMAQGRLSIESVGRLVQRERESCLRSAKAVYAPEYRSSWPGVGRSRSDGDDDWELPGCSLPEGTRCISDSLSDAAFTMELGECDFLDEGDAAPSRDLASYPDSPYCYSFCAWGGEEDSQKSWEKIVEEEPKLARFPVETVASEPGSQYHAHIPFARESSGDWVPEGPSTTESSARKKDTGVTPTNIEDGITHFGDDDTEHCTCKMMGTASNLQQGNNLTAYFKHRRGPSSLKRKQGLLRKTCSETDLERLHEEDNCGDMISFPPLGGR